MSMTYLFYDVETSGLNKCFDQVLQFAAIRTDMALNELERHEVFVKLNPDTIPSPFATITHHIGIELCQRDGMLEVEVIEKIHHMLNTPGTISLGYNTLTFDDELLRFAFYRNLLPPYTHQYANQCGRMDLYPMTTFFSLFKPDALPNWPEKDGRISLKLENLNAANQLATGAAHNALVDVEATIALARQLRQSTKMWDYLVGYFNKQTDQTRCANLAWCESLQQQIGLMIWGKIGARHHYQAPVLSLGSHKHYKNQTLWLRLDLPELQKTRPDNIDDCTWVLRKKLAEPGFLLPYNERYYQKTKPERRELVQKNLAWLMERPQLLAEIIEYHQHFKYPVYPSTDVDAALYQSNFWSSQETKQCSQFHQADPVQKSQLADQFGNSDLQQMATRLIGRNYPAGLSIEQKQRFQQYLQRVYCTDQAQALTDFTDQKRYTLSQFEQDFQEASQSDLSDTQRQLLQELRQHVTANQRLYAS